MATLAVSNESSQSCSRSSSVHNPRRNSWATLLHPRTLLSRTDPGTARGGDAADLESANGRGSWRELELEKFGELGLTLDAEEDAHEGPELRFSTDNGDELHVSAEEAPRVGRPFSRWMRTLQRRAEQRSSEQGDDGAQDPQFLGHRKSSSDCSFDYVTRVRSASVSISGSAITRSRRNTARSSQYAMTNRSSRTSLAASRHSEDSIRLERTPLDHAIAERLLQRRRILEELIHTEEGYIGDIKFLMNVYVTILASLPTQHPGLRTSINRNLTDIVELHEEILGELHRVVPSSDYIGPAQLLPAPKAVAKLAKRPVPLRWNSLNAVPEDKGGATWLQRVPSMTADPLIAAEVAKIFGERMHRLFVYEEYGAKYEMMIKDVASASRTMPQWETYQKGLEALAASLHSANHHQDHSKRSLTIGDLLVKPIQRICKYPLLFSELLKHTPVYDCPNSHAKIENVLVRLREATSEINRATDDPYVKVTMEKTWLLQDRLVFPNEHFDSTSKTSIRALGQIQLCGALHVCWQTREGVDGQYMVCLLYKDSLCLATASRTEQLYTIQACISLSTIKIEEADNGRGLQCHTAPFSWKLVFEVDHQLYEIIMTACAPKEEEGWRTRLLRSIPSEVHDNQEPPCRSSLSLNIKSLGTVFGKPGTVARRLSIHRATTIGAKSPLCQVILKNTTTMKDPSSAISSSPINRSQSLLTTNTRVPVLAPSRNERARLESLLADVWSRKILPFPGITSRAKSENLVRSSASTMIRKFSVASITSTFTKRSASSASGRAAKSCSHDSGRGNVGGSLVTLNCDFSTSSLNLEQELDEIQGFPSSRDETERTSSRSPSLPSTDPGAFSSALRKYDLSIYDPERSESPCRSREESPYRMPILLTTSANNSVPPSGSTSPSTKPASPVPMEKENIYQTRKQYLRSSRGDGSSPNPEGRRSRVAAINRGKMAGAIRNIFR